MQPFIVIGDKTSHGGTVVGGAPTASTLNKKIARVGDKVTCPKCGQNTIATGDNTMIIMGHPVARQGDKTACGATLISSQSVSVSGHSSGVGSSTANATASPSDASQADPRVPRGNSAGSGNRSYDRVFVIKNNQTGQPLPGAKYRLTLPDGTSVEGLTDAKGMTQRISGASQQSVKIEVYL